MGVKERALRVWERLQCGEHPLTGLPTILFLLTCGHLLFHLLRRQNLRLFHRRVLSKQLLFQTLFSWALMQTLRIWFILVHYVNHVLNNYWIKMGLLFPSIDVSISSGPDLSFLPIVLQFLIHPVTLQMIINSMMACIPLWIASILPDEAEMPNLMIWINLHRFNRLTELGSSSYFLSRPLSEGRHQSMPIIPKSLSESSPESLRRKRFRGRSLPPRTSSKILKRHSFPANTHLLHNIEE